jgi:hypothetical protein
MMSVVIPTLDSDRLLLTTLASLVPGSAAGLVREVLLADGGSRDAIDKNADVAGSELFRDAGDEAARLRACAGRARGAWLLFLDPGTVLEEGWTREIGVFIARPAQTGDRAATFRVAIDAAGFSHRLVEIAAACRLALLGTPRSDQGLLIAKSLYQALGGHAAGPRAHRRLLARIGRGRIVPLRSRIVLPSRSHT